MSSIIASQEEIHALFGGIVPEVASRKHTEVLTKVVARALDEASVTWSDLDGIAVTNGPGLIGSLLVGVSAAKAYHAVTGVPLVGVNHLQGHVSANFADICDNPLREEDLPAICLIVSGGHSDIIRLSTPTDYEVLAVTRDDAAGEAFDKAARVLQVGYPGGPAISRTAENGNPAAYDFPRPVIRDSLDFSFSGLKTALIRQVETIQREQGYETEKGEAPIKDAQTVADLAASFQMAIVDTLLRNTLAAVKENGVDHLAIAGGVAANRMLREKMAEACGKRGINLHFPPMQLCTDNAVMMAIAGHYQLLIREPDNMEVDVFSAMPE